MTIRSTIAALIGCAATAAFADSHPLIDAATTPGDISERVKDPANIAYCPDNTCDLFEAGHRVSRDELRTFAYLYLFAASDYTYLRQWRSKMDVQAAVMKMVPSHCKQGQVSASRAARCALSIQTTSRRVRVFMVRYDEGKKVRTSVDVKAALAKSPG